jgi:hypothetical protein
MAGREGTERIMVKESVKMMSTPKFDNMNLQ